MSQIKVEALGTPGAIESNAGDDYHILWACRRALHLLDPSYGLSLIRVEGVSRKDEISDGKIREKVLKNSPKENEEFFVVPKVVE